MRCWNLQSHAVMAQMEIWCGELAQLDSGGKELNLIDCCNNVLIWNQKRKRRAGAWIPSASTHPLIQFLSSCRKALCSRPPRQGVLSITNGGTLKAFKVPIAITTGGTLKAFTLPTATSAFQWAITPLLSEFSVLSRAILHKLALSWFMPYVADLDAVLSLLL